MADDWRVSLDFGDDRSASEHEEKLAVGGVAEDVARKLGRRVAVSRDGSKLFLYADDEDAARTAYHVVRSDIAGDKLPAAVELSRWHDEAEDWEPADRSLPQTEEEHRAEHARLMEREDKETAERGYSEWEVRLDLPSRQTAHELSERLDTEGVPHVRRWKYILVGATDEDAAKAWEERLRKEAPDGTKVRVEGTYATVAADRPSPFAILSELGGAP